MNKNFQRINKNFLAIRGFSLIEVVVVIILIGILAAVSIPELIRSRRMWRFAQMQQQLVADLRETRQLAMSQRQNVQFRYDDNTKQTVIVPNPPLTPRVRDLTGESLNIGDIKYEAMPLAPNSVEGGTAFRTVPVAGIVTVTFNSRGDAIDVAGAPLNYALFFYNDHTNNETAFAVSVLGLGGRVRIWRYNAGTNQYE